MKPEMKENMKREIKGNRKESRFVEWKERVSSTFLKTVSAYANYGTGVILFGIRDDGSMLGMEHPEDVCLDIENRINDAIHPKPDFSFSVDKETGVIALEVEEGAHKPYFYKGKAYKRGDTATVEVDQVELQRLLLHGTNRTFESLPSDLEHLTFEYFGKVAEKKLHVNRLSTDVLKTLGFYTEDAAFTVAGELFSDQNRISGIDIVRFGANIDEILDRETYAHQSILQQYDQAVALFERYYLYEKIVGMERVTVERIPKEAFREALANAVIQRVWDIPSHIRIAMYADKIELYSPGGLPSGVTKEDYLEGFISRLRNPVVANVFYRLNYIEMFGTGIARIKNAYRSYNRQPEFAVTENNIRITLYTKDAKEDVTTEEGKLLGFFQRGWKLSSAELVEKSGYAKGKLVRLLNALVAKGHLQKTGTGRSTKYHIV